MRFLALLIFLAVALPGVAHAADPDPADFTPPGYDFCGWRDFVDGGWAMEWREELSGAYLVLFSDGLSCGAARRNYGSPAVPVGR